MKEKNWEQKKEQKNPAYPQKPQHPVPGQNPGRTEHQYPSKKQHGHGGGCGC